jgi:hypothetical protein
MDYNDILPESNKIGDTKIDRVYMDLHGKVYVVLKDATTEYNVQKKSIKLDNGSLGHVYNYKNKWFDRTGMPIDKPNNLVTR